MPQSSACFSLKRWWIVDKNYAQVVLDFEGSLRMLLFQQDSIFGNLVKKDETGSVCNAFKSGSTRTAQIEHNWKVIAQCFVENPLQNQRKTSIELDISMSNLQRLLSPKLKPYRPRLLHALHEDECNPVK